MLGEIPVKSPAWAERSIFWRFILFHTDWNFGSLDLWHRRERAANITGPLALGDCPFGWAPVFWPGLGLVSSPLVLDPPFWLGSQP